MGNILGNFILRYNYFYNNLLLRNDLKNIGVYYTEQKMNTESPETDATNTAELRRARNIERVKQWRAKQMQENPDEYRRKQREYMRSSGKDREYYYANREVILQKQKERYKLKKMNTAEQN